MSLSLKQSILPVMILSMQMTLLPCTLLLMV